MPLRQLLIKVLLSCMLLSIAATVEAKVASPEAVVSNSQQEAILSSVGWTQNLNRRIPLDIPFVDSHGNVVKLSDYFGSKPVILTLMYFECPMLCGEVINGTFRGMQDLKFKAGRDFQYVAVSINPHEGPKLAAVRKADYLKRYSMPEEGIHFLTGRQKNIEALAKAVGFRYSYDRKSHSYAHPAGIILLTAEGRISHYMGGVVFHSQDLRLGLVDASQGEVGSLTDIILLKCCSFDPTTGKYNFAVQNLLRGGGVLILLCLGVLVFALTRHTDRPSGHSKK